MTNTLTKAKAKVGGLIVNGTEVTTTPAELNMLDGQVAAAVMTVGTEAANAINVVIQLNDAAGTAMAIPSALPYYLATDSAGLNASGTAPDGGIAIGTDGSMIEWTANLSGVAISEADGDIDITLTESGIATWYLVLVLPTGKLAVSDAITFA